MQVVTDIVHLHNKKLDYFHTDYVSFQKAG